jgi:predicted outer membrane repeat protein
MRLEILRRRSRMREALREPPCLETLESRVLYSADPVGAPVTALLDDGPRLEAAATRAAPAVESTNLVNLVQGRRELIVVAANLPDAERLAGDLLAAHEGNFELVTLRADRDALTQIGELLARADRPWDAVHVLAHAAPGRLDLGSTVGDRYLDEATLAARLGEIAGWGAGFTADGDLLLYGCELAGSAAGESLLEDLAGLLGVDVAASTDATGAAALGGNWTLEYALGDVESGFTLAAADWTFTLATVTANVFSDVVDGNIGSLSALSANPGLDGGISLREAVLAANATGASDTITLLAGTYTLNSQLVVDQHLGITGAGAGSTFIDGGGSTRLFEVTTNSLMLQKLTLQQGAASTGGALFVGSGVGVMLEEVALRGNSATYGGAVYSQGTLAATNVSFTNNTAGTSGGALYLEQGSASLANATISGNVASATGGAIHSNRPLSLTSSTVAHNLASGGAGGIFQEVGNNATLSNTLLADNTGGNANRALVSAGFNLDSDGSAGLTRGTDLNVAARLNPLSLGANGVYVHTLKNDSPAVDAGGGASAAFDATGLARNAIPDIGASENLAASKGKLYWADRGRSAIVRANLDGSASQLVVTGLAAPRGFAIDAVSGHIYWTDTTTKSVQRANLDGSDQVTLVSGLLGPFGVDVDPAGGHLYFADDGGSGTDDFLRRVDLDGTNLIDVLATSLFIRGVAVASETGSVFVSEAGSQTIIRSNLDGTASAVIASGADQVVNQPLNIAVDAVNSRVYWVNDGSGSGADSIVRANFDGTGRTTILTGLGNPQDIVIDAQGGFIYWAEKTAGQIGRADLDGGNVVRFSTGSSALRDLGLYTFSLFNTAPSGADATLTIFEDTPRFLAAADFGFTDPDGHAFAGVTLASLPGAGSLTLDGATVTAGQFVTAADIAANKLKFTPAANAFGANHASFTFRVRDAGGTANGGAGEDASANTLRFDVTAVNDAPSGTDATLTILEDTPRALTAADFTFTDVEGHGFAGVALASGPSAGSLQLDGVAVTAGQFVTAADIAAGKLVFTPAANASGANHASFTFRVRDNGGTASGGANQDTTPNTLRVDVAAVNDAPAGADATLTILEDTSRALAASDFGFTDTDGHAFEGVRIASLPGAGSLTLDGAAVTAGQFVGAADIAAGKLVFTPAANASGANHSSFTFRVRDDGGTANGGADEDASANTLRIDVTPVNDAPAGTDATITILEDAPRTLGLSDFGYSDLDGHAFDGVRIVTLPGAGQLALDGVAVTAGQFVTAAELAANKLVFTPVADANGANHASFTFRVRDAGGTANGGVDEDASANALRIDVTPVNDAPAGTDATLTILEDTPRALAAPDFGFTDPDGHAFAGVTLGSLPGAGSLTLDGAAVTAGQFVGASDIAAGKLVFTPVVDANGVNHASFTFRARDAGGTANGGVDEDASANTLRVDVKAVNDAPVGADWRAEVPAERFVLRPADFDFSDVDGQTLAALRIDSLPAEGRLLLAGQPVGAGAVVSVADLAAGSLVFDAGEVSARGVGFTFSVGDGASFDVESRRATLVFAEPPAMLKQMMQQAMQEAMQEAARESMRDAMQGMSQVAPMPVAQASPAPVEPRVPPADVAAAGPTDGANGAESSTPSPASEPAAAAAKGDSAVAPASGATVVDPTVAVAFTLPSTTAGGMRALVEAVDAAIAATPEAGATAEAARKAVVSWLAQAERAALEGQSVIGTLLAEIVERSRALGDGSGASGALDSGHAAGDMAPAPQNPGFIEALDGLRADQELAVVIDRGVLGGGVVASTGVSVGYVLWLLRGEFLLSGLLSSMPAWRMVDPLPVLAQLGDEGAGDDESLEQLVGGEQPDARLPDAGDESMFTTLGDYT